MEKVERMKLVDENGKTILMTKSKYLKLARQKGWDVKIPQLEDGTYDCDVFGGKGEFYNNHNRACLGGPIDITGTLFLGDNTEVFFHISARTGIIIGNNFRTAYLASDGDVILGDNIILLGSEHGTAISGKEIIVGQNLHAFGDIFANDGDAIIGENADIHGFIFSGKGPHKPPTLLGSVLKFFDRCIDCYLAEKCPK